MLIRSWSRYQLPTSVLLEVAKLKISQIYLYKLQLLQEQEQVIQYKYGGRDSTLYVVSPTNLQLS
jgi:hypothetical protein